jgi:hypothetical protein
MRVAQVQAEPRGERKMLLQQRLGYSPKASIWCGQNQVQTTQDFTRKLLDGQS